MTRVRRVLKERSVETQGTQEFQEEEDLSKKRKARTGRKKKNAPPEKSSHLLSVPTPETKENHSASNKRTRGKRGGSYEVDQKDSYLRTVTDENIRKSVRIQSNIDCKSEGWELSKTSEAQPKKITRSTRKKETRGSYDVDPEESVLLSLKKTKKLDVDNTVDMTVQRTKNQRPKEKAAADVKDNFKRTRLRGAITKSYKNINKSPLVAHSSKLKELAIKIIKNDEEDIKDIVKPVKNVTRNGFITSSLTPMKIPVPAITFNLVTPTPVKSTIKRMDCAVSSLTPMRTPAPAIKISPAKSPRSSIKKSTVCTAKVRTFSRSPSRKFTSSVKKQATSSVKKVPNYEAIHKRNNEKLESVDEYLVRKVNRAKALLSGKKVSVGKEQSFKGKEKVTEGPPKARISGISHIAKSPVKSVTKCKTSPKKGFVSKLPTLVKKPTIAPKENKEVKSRKEIAASVVTKNKPTVKDAAEKRRNYISGVRSNRRFDLLMKMRNVDL